MRKISSGSSADEFDDMLAEYDFRAMKGGVRGKYYKAYRAGHIVKIIPSDSNMTVIHFYEEFKPYGFLSNFASCPILLKGRLWPTTEHYYQAQKYAGTEREELIRQAPSPMNAKELTRDPAFPPRADWDAVKDSVMKEALLAKFSQHSHLREQLLVTGDATLVEHTENDGYWADGDGSGLNRLGAFLMEIRKEMRVGG